MPRVRWLLLAALGLVCTAHGTTIIVNVPDDPNVATGGIYGVNTDLRGALNFINSHAPDTYEINFMAPVGSSITLAAPLPPLNFPVAGQTFTSTSPAVLINSLTGPSFTINAFGFRPFYAYAGQTVLSHLTIVNGLAQGGNGGTGAGGGGAGLGGGLFVDSGATVYARNVEFDSCSVQGGAGGAVSVTMGSSGGGGGGLGGHGGAGGALSTSGVNDIAGGGGGGGFAPGTIGGTGADSAGSGDHGGSGGGGGFFGTGGNGGPNQAATTGSGGGGGGGFGGTNATGGNGGGASGPAVNAQPGGSGGQIPTIGGVSLGGGGGGGGTTFASGGAGGSGTGADACTSGFTALVGNNGGGGGVSTCGASCNCGNGTASVAGIGGGGGGGGGSRGDVLVTAAIPGGAGGIGGGGGGSTSAALGGTGGVGGGGGGGGGQGGFGGGGGGALAFTTIGGGLSQFGGGGGGCAMDGIHAGGNGGFGGGGGGKNTNAAATAGTAGVGGGIPAASAATSGGGGGAATGAAIFVNTGGQFIFLTDGAAPSCFITGSSAISTPVTPPNTSGAGFVKTPFSPSTVQSIFSMSGNTLHFVAQGPAETVVVEGAIADDTILSMSPAADFRLPDASNAGSSVAINFPTGAGTVVLSGISTYGGNGTSSFTKIYGGTFRIEQDESMGAPSVPLIFSGNSTLQLQMFTPIPSSIRPITVEAGVIAQMDINSPATFSGPISMGDAASNLTKIGTDILTLDGNNSSAGSYTVDAGTLMLGGVNTYTGATTINAGAFLEGGAPNAFSPSSPHVINGTGAINLNHVAQSIGSLESSSAAAQVFLGLGTLTVGGDNTSTTFAGQISGSGGLIHVGTGALTLTADSSYTGPTLVSGGTLIVNGLIASLATVASGGTLKGIGSLPGAVVQGGGTIQAGNSIGTISLGSLTLTSGANLQLEVAPPKDDCSLYAVTGDVSLGGATLNVLLTEPAANYGATTTYTFITSTTQITGTFAVVNTPPGFAAVVDYSNPKATVLRRVSAAQIGAGVSLSHNERVMLSYLAKLTSVSALHPLLMDLAMSTPSELRASLDSICPSRNAAATYFANQVFFSVGDISSDRLSEGRLLQTTRERQTKLAVATALKQETLLALADIPPADALSDTQPAGQARTAAAEKAHYAFWATGFGDFLSQDARHKNPTIHDTATGAVVGCNYYGTQNGIFTASAGYIHNDITENHHMGSGISNGFSVGLYGTGTIGKGYIEGGLLFGWSQFSMDRHIVVTGSAPIDATAKSTFGDWQFMPHLGGGYDWMMNWGVIEPFVSIDWAGSRQSAYTEKGASPLNMHIKSQTPSILRSQAGVNFYETWEWTKSLLLFEQSISYVNKVPLGTHVRGALTVVPSPLPSGVPGSFTVLSYDRVLNLGSAGAELFYKHKPSGFFVSATYQGEFGTNYISNNVTGTLGVFF